MINGQHLLINCHHTMVCDCNNMVNDQHLLINCHHTMVSDYNTMVNDQTYTGKIDIIQWFLTIIQ